MGRPHINSNNAQKKSESLPFFILIGLRHTESLTVPRPSDKCPSPVCVLSSNIIKSLVLPLATALWSLEVSASQRVTVSVLRLEVCNYTRLPLILSY